MLLWLGFGSCFKNIIVTLFVNASSFDYMNGSLRLHNNASLHQARLPLAPHLYVSAMIALKGLLEVANLQRTPSWHHDSECSEVINNHSVNDSLLFVCLDQNSVEFTLSYLDTFCVMSSVVVSNHKL
jgi:hypothetical protein